VVRFRRPAGFGLGFALAFSSVRAILARLRGRGRGSTPIASTDTTGLTVHRADKHSKQAMITGNLFDIFDYIHSEYVDPHAVLYAYPGPRPPECVCEVSEV
jgi:hypothetical protein